MHNDNQPGASCDFTGNWDGPEIGIIAIGSIAGAIFENQTADLSFLSRKVKIEAISSLPGLSIAGIEVSIAKGSGSHFEPSVTGCEPGRYREEISSAVAGLHLLFVLVDQAEHPGGEILLAVADAIREAGIPTIAVAIAVPADEGERQWQTASAAYRALCQHSNVCLLIGDDQQAPLAIFAQIYRSIVMPSTTEGGWVGVDFEDVMSVFAKHSGESRFGIGTATGKGAEEVALQLAVRGPSLGETSLGRAATVLVTIEGRSDIVEFAHIKTIMREVRMLCSDAHVIFGAYSVDELATDFRVTMIANDIGTA